MLEGGSGLRRRWRWAITWATMVGADGGQRRVTMWVTTWAMTRAMTMAGLMADNGGVVLLSACAVSGNMLLIEILLTTFVTASIVVMVGIGRVQFRYSKP
jgi:hypothetical protein